jgi:hypothetical protein
MPPHKIAIFAEGQTEQIFVSRLLAEIAGYNRIRVEVFRVLGGRRFSRILYKLTPDSQDEPHPYYAMIVDCTGDSRVTSEVRDQYETLISAGYTAIIAIRDVAPDFTRNEIPRLISEFRRFLRQSPVEPLLVLPTMEIEAWFIGECTHFGRIHNYLTLDAIREKIGVDLIGDDIEGRAHPAADLDSIYQLANLRYTKSKADVERTVACLDYEAVRQGLSQKVPSLAPLIKGLESFLR